jgi:hypothetical protein
MSNSSNYGSRFIDGLTDKDSRTKDFHIDESFGESAAYTAGSCIAATTIAAVFMIGLGIMRSYTRNKSKKDNNEQVTEKNDSSKESNSEN